MIIRNRKKEKYFLKNKKKQIERKKSEDQLKKCK